MISRRRTLKRVGGKVGEGRNRRKQWRVYF